MAPVISVKADLVTQNENYIYVPIASRDTYGTVKVGAGLLITDGALSLDSAEVPVLTIAKNGVDIIPDENKRVNIELTRVDVGLDMVDNTSDMDKPISVAQRTEFDKKINTYQGTVYADKVLAVGEDGYVTLKSVGVTLDKFAMDGLSVNRKNDGLSIYYTSFNLKTLANKTDSVLLPLASDAESGLMSSADYASIRDLQSRMNRVENRASKLFYDDTVYPTSEEINAFVESLGYSAPFEGISVLVSGTHHIWHYYENAGWIDDGIDIVDQFTNTTLGVIKGSSVIGKIYAETDGTGSVNGWDALVGRVDGLDDSYTSVGDEITKQTKRIDGVYERADGLEADIQDLQGQIDEIHTDNLVDLETNQEIGGVKTFKNQVGFKNEDGTIDYIKHINNNLLITTSAGANLLNIDEGLSRVYFFNKEIAFKEDIGESSGTTVKVGGVAVAEFDADTKVDDTIDTNGSFKAGNAKSATNGGIALGNGARSNYGASVGIGSVSVRGGAVGQSTITQAGGAMGYTASSANGGAIGNSSMASDGGAVGQYASAGKGFSGGDTAQVELDSDGLLIDAIQLGTGMNSIPKSLQIYDDNIYNADTHTLDAQVVKQNGQALALDSQLVSLATQVATNYYNKTAADGKFATTEVIDEITEALRSAEDALTDMQEELSDKVSFNDYETLKINFNLFTEEVVKLSGDQTIGGQKTFTNDIIINGAIYLA